MAMLIFNSSLRSPLFSFVSGPLSRASLAGDNRNGSKNIQLPLLWQNIASRLSKQYPQKEGQMPYVRQLQKLEGWAHKSTPIVRRSTVLMQRLRHSIYRALTTLLVFLFFVHKYIFSAGPLPIPQTTVSFYVKLSLADALSFGRAIS